MTKATTQMEAKGMSQRSEDLMQVYKTLAFDFPMVSVRWALGVRNDKESTTAMWKGYDAGVRLATATVDSLYRSQSLSEIVGNTVNQLLRVQQLSNAANGFIATSLLRPFTLALTPETQPLTTAVDTHLNNALPAQPRVTTAPRPRKRRVRVQESTPTPAYPLARQDELRAAA